MILGVGRIGAAGSCDQIVSSAAHVDVGPFHTQPLLTLATPFDIGCSRSPNGFEPLQYKRLPRTDRILGGLVTLATGISNKVAALPVVETPYSTSVSLISPARTRLPSFCAVIAGTGLRASVACQTASYRQKLPRRAVAQYCSACGVRALLMVKSSRCQWAGPSANLRNHSWLDLPQSAPLSVEIHVANCP